VVHRAESESVGFFVGAAGLMPRQRSWEQGARRAKGKR
jgi:hypothetical protein